MMLTENGAKPITCDNTPHWDQFGPTIKVEKGEGELNFTAARIVADAEAARLSPDPMLLAWYEAGSGEFSPRVDSCCAKKKPGWLIYAESRGGEIQIVINDLEYVFIYRP